MVIAQPLILLFLGPAFAPSGVILEVLGLVLFLTYLNTMLGQLLISVDRIGRWNLAMIFATILTLLLDLFLVPWAARMFGNGGLGGVISYAITESMMLAAAILLLPKGTFAWSNLRTVGLTMVAGLGMVSACWWLRERNLALAVLVGAITYLALVLLLRILSSEDLALLKAGGAQVLMKLRGGKRAAAHIGSE
jgi:O-antigen/teichoic acid export membrane protein